MLHWRTFAVLAALNLAPPAAAADSPPDLSGFWSVRFEQPSSAAARALLEQLPEDAVFINDAGGGELAEGEYSGLVLSERARREVANYDFDSEFSRDYTCVQPSAAFYMQAPFPMEIYQGRDLIVFKMEYFDMYRVIFMDGREHPPADAPHFKSGHSVGRWEGDELVVDTTHIAAATFMNNGFNHSDDLHMVERFHLGDDGVLRLVQLYQDPDTFQGRAYRYMAWTRQPGEYVYPYECDPSFGE